MSDIVLVQPPPAGRISGGYLYNQAMAAQGAWRLRDVEPAHLSSLRSDSQGESLLLVDSIWLTENTIEVFLELRDRGRRVGVMLHSFPSMIHAAEAGKPLVTRPTRFEAQALERLGLVVTLGEHYPRMLAESRVEVVLAPPGVDEGWRRPPRPKAGRCRVVSVGSLTPRKGFLDAARVLGGRGGDDFEWHVVGSAGADAEYVRSVERAVHGCSNVRFWGQLPPAKTRELVLESDVLLMPSYDENHPLVLVEALAASVPPVAYAAGATSTIVRHERCGLVAPIGDLDGLAEHLDRVIRDEPFRFGLAEACFERQDELPTWQAAAEHARVRLAAVL